MAAQVLIDDVLYGAPVYGGPDGKNIGGLVIVAIGEIECLIEKHRAELLGLTEGEIIDIDKAPQFLHEQYLEIEISPKLVNKITFYPLKKEDIAKLGVLLSKRFGRCYYHTQARYLASWSGGSLVRSEKLSHYYDNISAEDDLKYSL